MSWVRFDQVRKVLNRKSEPILLFNRSSPDRVDERNIRQGILKILSEKDLQSLITICTKGSRPLLSSIYRIGFVLSNKFWLFFGCVSAICSFATYRSKSLPFVPQLVSHICPNVTWRDIVTLLMQPSIYRAALRFYPPFLVQYCREFLKERAKIVEVALSNACTW